MVPPKGRVQKDAGSSNNSVATKGHVRERATGSRFDILAIEDGSHDNFRDSDPTTTVHPVPAQHPRSVCPTWERETNTLKDIITKKQSMQQDIDINPAQQPTRHIEPEIQPLFPMATPSLQLTIRRKLLLNVVMVLCQNT